jgi:hypothetical protein
MHKILFALALTMIPPACAPAYPQELKVEKRDDGSVVLTIPAEAVAQCVAQRCGCQLWSNEAVLEVAQKAVKAHCAKEI